MTTALKYGGFLLPAAVSTARIHDRNPKMTALAQIQTRPAAELNRIHLLTDGNSHRPELCPAQIGFSKPHLASEALIPQIRTVAMLIAAARHDFSSLSPETFTEEADWFAARIIVLNARLFHLDITLKPMLAVANRRAEAFARRHGLPFVPAQMRMSLHAGRPANLLIVETACHLSEADNLLGNSRALAAQSGLPDMLQL